MREEKETRKERGKGKGKGLLERLFGKRSKRSPSKLERSEDNPSSESCVELEAKTFLESGNECSQIASISSDNPGIEGAAASILSKYFTCLVCDRSKIIRLEKGKYRKRKRLKRKQIRRSCFFTVQHNPILTGLENREIHLDTSLIVKTLLYSAYVEPSQIA